MTKCISDKVKATILESSTQVNAAAQTASIDLQEIAHQGIRVKLNSITALDAANDVRLKLQESDDDAVFTDVERKSDAGEVNEKLMSALAAGEEHSLPYEGIKRYLRLSFEVAAGAPDIVVDAYSIEMPHLLPA